MRSLLLTESLMAQSLYPFHPAPKSCLPVLASLLAGGQEGGKCREVTSRILRAQWERDVPGPADLLD